MGWLAGFMKIRIHYTNFLVFMTRPVDTTSDPNRSANSTAGGIFRGLLTNVSSSVVGGIGQSGNQQLEQKIEELMREIAVLQEELESKISENERLVIEGSEVRREKRELEVKCSSLEKSLVEGNRERSDMESKMVKLKSEKDKMHVINETNEITIDSLRRDMELQNEQLGKYRSLYENLSSQLSELTARNSLLESESREYKSNASISESLLDQLRSELSESERSRTELEHAFSEEKILNQSLSLQVKQLEDEISISIATSQVAHHPPPSPSSRFSPRTVPEGCRGGGDPCCYRSEYYITRCKNLEHALKTVKNSKHY
jgi:regulator of replication initiation timing